MRRSERPLRILFIGETGGNSTSVHYFSSLLRLGHAVYPFDPDPFRARNFIEKAVVRLRKQPSARVLAETHRQLVSLAASNAFDLVFVMGQNFIGHETIDEMRASCPQPAVFVYHSHDNNFAPGVLKPKDFEKTLRAYDHVFTTKSQNVQRYRNLGQKNAYYIPSAYEPSVHRPVPLSASAYGQNFEVSFVGTYDGSREPWLEAVGWHRLHVWGNLWKKSRLAVENPERIHGAAVYFHQYADVLSRSLCSLGLLREEAEDLHTQRTFEIPACGSLQIAPRNHEILSLFKEDKEIVCFDSPEELREKVDYYLSHETERNAIIRRAHDRLTREKHTYQDRTEEILKVALPKKARLKRVA